MANLSPSEAAIITTMEDVSLTTPSVSTEQLLLSDSENTPQVDSPRSRASKRRREEEMDVATTSSPARTGTKMTDVDRTKTSRLVKMAMSRMGQHSTGSSTTESNRPQGKNNTFLSSLLTQPIKTFPYSLSDYSPTSNNENDTMSKTNSVYSIVGVPSTSRSVSYMDMPGTSGTRNVDLPQISVTVHNNGAENNANTDNNGVESNNANRDNNASTHNNQGPSNNATANNATANNGQSHNATGHNNASGPVNTVSQTTMSIKGERLPLTRIEADLFRQLRNQQEKLMRYRLHNDYLSKYKEANMVPRGLTLKCPPYFEFNHRDVQRLWLDVLRQASFRLLEITIMNINSKIDTLQGQWVELITSIEDNQTIKDHIKVAIIEKVSNLVDVKKHQLTQAKNQKWARDQQSLQEDRENVPPPAGAPKRRRTRAPDQHNNNRRPPPRQQRRRRPRQTGGGNRLDHIINQNNRSDIIQGLLNHILS